MVSKFRTLEILCVLNTYFPVEISAPSWMPDWRDNDLSRPYLDDKFDYLSRRFAAAGQTVAEVRDPMAWGNLQVTEFRVDLHFYSTSASAPASAALLRSLRWTRNHDVRIAVIATMRKDRQITYET